MPHVDHTFPSPREHYPQYTIHNHNGIDDFTNNEQICGQTYNYLLIGLRELLCTLRSDIVVFEDDLLEGLVLAKGLQRHGMHTHAMPTISYNASTFVMLYEFYCNTICVMYDISPSKAHGVTVKHTTQAQYKTTCGITCHVVWRHLRNWLFGVSTVHYHHSTLQDNANVLNRCFVVPGGADAVRGTRGAGRMARGAGRRGRGAEAGSGM